MRAVDREAFAADQPGRHAAPHHALERQTKGVAPAEPAIGQVEMRFFAQATLPADAEAEPTIGIRIIGSASATAHIAGVLP